VADGYVDADGDRIHFEVVGSGPAVILLHAGVADSRSYDRQVEGLSGGFRVIRYDHRGFGRSDPPSKPFSIVEDVARVLDHVGEEHAAVVGNSLGGAVAVEYAVAHPERVSALVPVAAGLIGYDATASRHPRLADAEKATERGDYMAAAEIELDVWSPLRTDPETDELLRRMALDNAGAEALPDELFLLPDPPAVARLEEISAPTLVVIGDRDVEVMEEISDLLASRIPGARKAVIENADHIVPTRQPERLNTVLTDFLEGVL
jgi:3-oxoadipate enol-lactonase